MASFLRPTGLCGALHRPGVARPQKLTLSVKPPTSRNAVPCRAPAAAAVESPTAPPSGAPGRRPALYLLHSHLPRSKDAQDGSVSQEQLRQLHDGLKAMEKVAKRAAWFSTIEASDGEHVLLLTDSAKLSRKYGLQTMPIDASSFTLDLPGRSVLVPLAEVSAALLAQEAEEGSKGESSSLEEEEELVSEIGKQIDLLTTPADKDADKKAARKRLKELEKAAKALVKAEKEARKDLEGGQDCEDNPDEEDADEERKEKVKAEKKKKKEKKEMEKGMKEATKEAKKKEENNKAAVAEAVMADDDSDDDESSSGSESDEEVSQMGAGMGITIDAKSRNEEAEVKVEKMAENVQDGSDSESEEESGSGSEEEEGGGTIPRAATTEQGMDATEPQAMGKDDECDSESEGGSSSSSSSSEEESGTESDGDEEVVMKKGMEAAEIGEIAPLEA